VLHLTYDANAQTNVLLTNHVAIGNSGISLALSGKPRIAFTKDFYEKLRAQAACDFLVSEEIKPWLHPHPWLGKV